MKVVILAGGLGTRLSEETTTTPKPMVEIGGKPILWHIMKIYSYYGYNEFIICLGYKGYIIKEYFHHYFLHQSDVTINLLENHVEFHDSHAEPWKITLVDTGIDTLTGGRIKRIEKFINNEAFMVTYGDGVANIDINALLEFHASQGKMATLTAVQPLGRFGAIDVSDSGGVTRFQEKPKGDNSWVNGGFYVFEPEVFRYLKGDHAGLESEPLEALAKDGQLSAYKHSDFWLPMDTLRDKNELENLWRIDRAEWKLW